MTCALTRGMFSDLRDGALGGAERGAIAAHLDACGACAAEWRGYNAALDGLADLPGVECAGEVTARVFDRLDLENRKPGLALLFRPSGAARPLMLPSLMASAMLLATAVGVTLVLDERHEPLPAVAGQADDWGTERHPLAVSADVSTPRARDEHGVPAYLLEPNGVGSVFVETVVARDGTVSSVHLIGGDSRDAEPLLEALGRQRFEPGRFRGRPVAVSLYRLIDRIEVRAPIT
jgi:hypothetical protein